MDNNGETTRDEPIVPTPAPPVEERLATMPGPTPDPTADQTADRDLEHENDLGGDLDEETEEERHAEERVEEEDLTPEDGDVLQAGDYLVELETVRACPREVLTEGLRRIGFAEVLLDQSTPSARPPSLVTVRQLRFVGRLARGIALHQQADARWTYARRLKTDILSELRLKFKDYPLVSGRIYEVRFLSRMRSQPTRPMVELDLHEMGWEVLKLSALRRDMRIPGRQSASVTLWFAVCRWDAVDSYVSEDDPFYFEDVALV